MIHIFTALYPEAKPLIQALNLKKRTEQTHYQQFVSEAQDLTLTTTGVGSMNAAMVVASVLTAYGAGSGDQLLSLGTAAELWRVKGEKKANAESGIRQSTAAASLSAAAEPPESLAPLYHIHCITDKESGRSFYPDMLLHTALPEAGVVTGAKLLTMEERSLRLSQEKQHTSSLKMCEERADGDECTASKSLVSDGVRTSFASRMADETLYDMEAAGVYQAASMFLGPHQMNFLRIVTDQGLTGSELADPKVLSEHVTECVASQVEKLLEIVDKLREISREKEQSGPSARENVGSAVDRLILDAHFSRVMADECRQLLRYAELTQLDWRSAVEALYREGRVPTRDKRAGKKILEELKRTLLCF